MSSAKNGKKKDIKIILLGILVGLVVCGAGIYGVVSSRIASHEYKNSTDIREVSAVVGYCREIVKKDEDENEYHRERKLREYRVKVTLRSMEKPTKTETPYTAGTMRRSIKGTRSTWKFTERQKENIRLRRTEIHWNSCSAV